jgi:leucyl aminopeptidase (aminopeptidase T)
MKKLLLFLLLTFSLQAWSQKTDYDAVATRIVSQSLEVTKGEHVLITGNPEVQEIMEAMYVAVSKAGGLPVVRMYLPNADVRVSKETKLEYLAQPNYADAVLDRMVDCVVNIDYNSDPDRWKDITTEVRKAYRESGEPSRNLNRHDRVRVVSLGQTDGIPTLQVAAVFGADYQEMQQNFWKAVSADHAELKARADKVTAKLKPGSQVKVTTAHGTDISFRLAANAPMASCGSTMDQLRNRGDNFAWLPAGDVFTAIDPSSANGTIVMPAYFMGSTKFTNLKLVYKAGKIQTITADQDISKFKERLLAYGAENAMLSSIDLGINPHSKVIGDYRSFEMAGMVSLGGGNNQWAGGEYAGTTDYYFHLKDATLEVGDQNVVKNGALSSK